MKELAEALGILVYDYDLSPLKGCFFIVNGIPVIGVDTSLDDSAKQSIIDGEIELLISGKSCGFL